jgi:hypothetical protein
MHTSNFRSAIALCGAFILMVTMARGAFTAQELASGSNEVVNGNTESIWRRVLGNYDFNTDQQTGQGQSDIIGTDTDPALAGSNSPAARFPILSLRQGWCPSLPAF